MDDMACNRSILDCFPSVGESRGMLSSCGSWNLRTTKQALALWVFGPGCKLSVDSTLGLSASRGFP